MAHPYSDEVFDHFRHPRNHGPLLDPTISQAGSNPLCGDHVRIELRLDGERVEQAGFTANACAICVAAASVLTDLVRGAYLEDVETFSSDELLKALDAELSRARLPCATLPLTVLHAGIALHRQAHPAPPFRGDR